MDKKIIKRDVLSLYRRKDVLAVLLFGSYCKGEETERSDVDICVVAPKCNYIELFKEINITLKSSKYDVKIFECLPLYLKSKVIENHEIIFAKDVYKLYEYFYFFRKLWIGQRHRQEISKEDIIGQKSSGIMKNNARKKRRCIY